MSTSAESRGGDDAHGKVFEGSTADDPDPTPMGSTIQHVVACEPMVNRLRGASAMRHAMPRVCDLELYGLDAKSSLMPSGFASHRPLAQRLGESRCMCSRADPR